MLQCDEDIQEREGYAADLEAGNFENDLHHTANNARIGDSDLLSGCLYTDVNDTQEHPTMKLVSAITNYKSRSNNDNTNSLILTYQNNGYVTPLNDWDNPEYFTASFPTLSPFGIGGHLSTANSPKKEKNAIRGVG